jgi:hypothetical protein
VSRVSGTAALAPRIAVRALAEELPPCVRRTSTFMVLGFYFHFFRPLHGQGIGVRAGK